MSIITFFRERLTGHTRVDARPVYPIAGSLAAIISVLVGYRVFVHYNRPFMVVIILLIAVVSILAWQMFLLSRRLYNSKKA